MSIISLENEYAQYTSPPLTTIDIPLEKMGSRSVDAIKSILDGNKPSNLLRNVVTKLRNGSFIKNEPSEEYVPSEWSITNTEWSTKRHRMAHN